LVFYGLTIIVICDARKQRAKILLFFDIRKFFGANRSRRYFFVWICDWV